jgi:hypothetical protein
MDAKLGQAIAQRFCSKKVMLRLHLCKEMYRQRRNHAEKRQISLHKCQNQ